MPRVKQSCAVCHERFRPSETVDEWGSTSAMFHRPTQLWLCGQMCALAFAEEAADWRVMGGDEGAVWRALFARYEIEENEIMRRWASVFGTVRLDDE